MKKIIKDFILNHSLIMKSMQGCEHSYSLANQNPYHLEGDVWTHTMLVCKSLENEIKELKYSGLLHDIGKPASKKIDNIKKRVTFYGHENLSLYKSISILGEVNCLTLEEKINILLLISKHSDFQRKTKEELEEKYVNNKKLFEKVNLFFNADNDGKIMMETMSKVNIEEYRFLEREILKKDKKLVLLIGPPLSGKTKWLNRKKRANDIYIITRDKILKENFSYLGDTIFKISRNMKKTDYIKLDNLYIEEMKEGIKSGRDIYVDSYNMSKRDRKLFLEEIGDEYNKESICFFIDIEELYERNRNKKRTPKISIDYYCKRLEVPLLDEFDYNRYVFKS